MLKGVLYIGEKSTFCTLSERNYGQTPRNTTRQTTTVISAELVKSFSYESEHDIPDWEQYLLWSGAICLMTIEHRSIHYL